MEPPEFWRDLKIQFLALANPGVYAMDLRDGTWAVHGGSADRVRRESLEAQFKAIAVRGALAAELCDSTVRHLEPL
jgi:hypothetical protein